ncbi:MAG: hypothetical protein H8E28_04785 [Anaerolineae bacterium]|nr:hypothetical protein [Anaerolineae bacterium]
MKTFAYDLGYVEAGLEELESYLLGNDLFWPLNAPSPIGEPPFGQLTLGGLLFAVAQLEPRAESPQRRAETENLIARLEVTRTKWRVAWEEKSAWEFRSRLRQWGQYIHETQRDLQEHGVYYAQEVRLRVLLELLLKEMRQPEPADLQTLAMLDAIVHGWLIVGDFLWGEELQIGFPQETYWYLWGNILR